MEYRDPIDLMDCPSNMEIGLFWNQKGPNNNWTYDLIDHLMVDLEEEICISFYDIYYKLLRCL